jgi:hypothetical protein
MTTEDIDTDTDTETEMVWIVVEELEMRTRIRHVFDTETMADKYIEDDENVGALFVEGHTVESEYDVIQSR